MKKNYKESIRKELEKFFSKNSKSELDKTWYEELLKSLERTEEEISGMVIAFGILFDCEVEQFELNREFTDQEADEWLDCSDYIKNLIVEWISEFSNPQPAELIP